MFKIFNNKLYNQFYPLITVEDKNNFLNSNYMEVYLLVRDIAHSARNDYYYMKMDYINSFFGMEKTIQNLELLEDKLFNFKYEDITNDELNHVLKLANASKHKTWGMFLLSLLLLTIIVCICILN